ncbi:MAG: PrsW family intramembrane metalloprotease [Bacilli bacterium]|nr:PrsW family intramembrane metalloprotease [Bacilli bacterium]
MSETLVFLAVLPSILLGTYIYKKDTVEKESTKLLIILLICGLLATITTFGITEIVKIIFPIFDKNALGLDGLSLVVYVLFGIALIEEFSKWIYIYLICWKHKEFNYAYDAIVYSVFVSLGFATIENILYVDAYNVALFRMILSVPAHAFFGVMMGYYLGLAKISYNHKYYEKSKFYKLLSLLIPVFCHFMYDYLIFADKTFLFYSFVLVLYYYSYRKVKRLSKINRGIFNGEGEIYGKFGSNKV